MPFSTLCKVKCDNLLPEQQPTSPRFARACDYYEQNMIKHPARSIFHCYSELLHAALLEGNKNVISYTPQPLRLKVGGRIYIPDVYVTERTCTKVIELKPRGEFAEEMKIPLEQYFKQRGLIFEVVSNESVLDRKIEAENWLNICRRLYLGKELTTDAEEEAILYELSVNEKVKLYDIVDPEDRESSIYKEVALMRLLHRGLASMPLMDDYLRYDMEVKLC